MSCLLFGRRKPIIYRNRLLTNLVRGSNLDMCIGPEAHGEFPSGRKETGDQRKGKKRGGEKRKRREKKGGTVTRSQSTERGRTETRPDSLCPLFTSYPFTTWSVGSGGTGRRWSGDRSRERTTGSLRSSSSRFRFAWMDEEGECVLTLVRTERRRRSNRHVGVGEGEGAGGVKGEEFLLGTLICLRCTPFNGGPL